MDNTHIEFDLAELKKALGDKVSGAKNRELKPPGRKQPFRGGVTSPGKPKEKASADIPRRSTNRERKFEVMSEPIRYDLATDEDSRRKEMLEKRFGTPKEKGEDDEV